MPEIEQNLLNEFKRAVKENTINNQFMPLGAGSITAASSVKLNHHDNSPPNFSNAPPIGFGQKFNTGIKNSKSKPTSSQKSQPSV